MKKPSDFATKKDFFAYLVENKTELIDIKKRMIIKSNPNGASELQKTFLLNVKKGLSTSYNDDVTTGEIERDIIGNTYYWDDHSNDVLIPNVFVKSIKETLPRIRHDHDHKQEITAKVGKPQEIYEKSVLWSDLGVNRPSSTVCLFMKSKIIEKWNTPVFYQYLSGEIDQHSVEMQYTDIVLAINDPERKSEFSEWNKYINLIGNWEKTMENGFFWAVKQGKLFAISSVINGCNELTPTIPNKTEKNICLEIKELQEKLQNFDKNDKNIIAELKNLNTFVSEIITSKNLPSSDTDLKKPIDLKNLSTNFKLNLNDTRTRTT